MTDLENRLFAEICAIRAIDCHSHVPAASPHAQGLADLLGYHYYTELVHSAGMRAEDADPRRPQIDRVAAMVEHLPAIENTVQYGWLMQTLRDLFGFRGERLTADNWPQVDQAVAEAANQPERYREVLARSNLEKVFLTNAFDEDLDPVDREVFVPCLRTDDLVFGLAEASVRRRLAAKTGIEVGSADDLRDAVRWLMRYFAQHGASAAAVSLPPDFVPAEPDEAEADAAIAAVARGKEVSEDDLRNLSVFVFDVLVDACRRAGKPFQLMIGVIRNVYPAGVEGGRDLFASTGTLHQYAGLFRRYPEVDFTVSVLARTWAHELATFAWIFPNVRPSGHWWYLNVPVHIAYELRARLEAVPQTKLIGYYSDMYKVEFGLPKFSMYRRVLTRVLAREFVEPGRMSESQALATARLLLRENPKRLFGV